MSLSTFLYSTPEKKPLFFTPYRNTVDFLAQGISPFMAPITCSLVATWEALQGVFYLIKGLVQTITLQHTQAKTTFKQSGTHFSDFILAATLAILTPFLGVAMFFTRAAGTFFNSQDTTTPGLA